MQQRMLGANNLLRCRHSLTAQLSMRGGSVGAAIAWHDQPATMQTLCLNFTMFSAMTWLNSGPHRGKHTRYSLATSGTQYMAAHGPNSKQNILPTTHNKKIRLLKSTHTATHSLNLPPTHSTLHGLIIARNEVPTLRSRRNHLRFRIQAAVPRLQRTRQRPIRIHHETRL